MYKELLIGCGHRRNKEMGPYDHKEFKNLVTLDHNEDCAPDIVHDLNSMPYPFNDNEFDEIHAYDVLEHCGTQGDYKFFFAQFTEFWRILKPYGWFFATVPRWDGMWAFGDPSHTRILPPGCFTYLSQKQYDEQIGITKMTDFRNIYEVDFEVVKIEEMDIPQINVYMQAIKE